MKQSAILKEIFSKLPRITDEISWLGGKEYFFNWQSGEKRPCYKFRKDRKGISIWNVNQERYRPVTEIDEIRYINDRIKRERIIYY